MSNFDKIKYNILEKKDPFEEVYKTYQKERDLFTEYNDYSDHLRYTRTILRRIVDDLSKSGIKYEELNHIKDEARTEGYKPRAIRKDFWEPIYELQLDLESLVIFSKILLDKFGIIAEVLLACRSPNNYARSFTKHRKWFSDYDDNIKGKNSVDHTLLLNYCKLLKSLNWYQTLDILRNKVIAHGGSLVGSIRTTKNGVEYRRTTQHFGILINRDKTRIEEMIHNYGQNNNEISKIQLNPAMMLDEFLRLVLEHNIEIESKDLNDLGLIVSRNGGRIDSIILYKQIDKFLDDAAQIFQNKKVKV
jgi:hypothetical protein